MNRLKELRVLKGWNQEYVAKEANTTRVSISRYETGIREPDYETLLNLAHLYNVSVDYILGNTDNPTPPTEKEQKETSAKAKDDVGELLDDILEMLGADSGINFNGKPMSSEAKELLLASLEANIKLADTLSALKQKEAEAAEK